MHAKTMEGLVGARTNMELLNTPFRVSKEARLKGDTAKMEQAPAPAQQEANAEWHLRVCPGEVYFARG